MTHVALFALPFLWRRQAFISLWGLVFLVVATGMGVRGLLIALAIPSQETIDRLFLRGSTFDDLLVAAVQMTLVMAAAVGGYVYVLVRPQQERGAIVRRGLRATDLSGVGAFLIAVVYVAIGLIGTVGYASRVGGLDASTSERRAGISATGAPFQSYGEFEFLAGAGVVGAVFLLTAWLSRYQRLGLARALIVVCAFLAAFSINFITTARADLVFVTASGLAVVTIIRGHVRTTVVLGVVMAALLGIAFLSAERSGAQEDAGVVYGVESALLNRNAVDLSKTLKITDAVPDVLPYQYGRTIANYFIAPIPRTIWPDKPVISPGPLIGRTVYDLERSGVPPGLSAELVWNFGWFLSIPIAWLVGYGLARVEERTRPRDPGNLTSVVFYALVTLTLGKAVFGVSLGQALASAAQTAIWIAPIFFLGLSKRRSESRHHGRVPATTPTVGRSRVVG